MGLPGSFEFTGNNIYSNGYYNNYVKAKIRYKVKAECEVPGMLKPNLRGKVHVVVHERMSKMPSQVVVEDRQSITTCCCCGQVREIRRAHTHTHMQAHTHTQTHMQAGRQAGNCTHAGAQVCAVM